MNCRILLFICILLALTLPSANCHHSVTKRNASPFFHLLFPNRRRLRKPKKVKLRKPPPQHYINYEDQFGFDYLEPPHHPPPPPVKNPEYGPNHIPQKVNNFGHNILEEGFGPYDEYDYKNQNYYYEEPPNHIPPHSKPPSLPPPPPQKIPNHPPFSFYPNPSHSGPHPQHFSSHSPHSGPHPPPPSKGQNPSTNINHGHIQIIKVPPISLNEILTKPKPVKFPKKPNNNKINMFDLRDETSRKKAIADIVKQTIYYGEYPKNKDKVIDKERVQPLLLPAGVKGLDPNSLDYVKARLREYAKNQV